MQSATQHLFAICLKNSDKDLHEFPTSVRSRRKPSCFCENKFNIFQNWNKILNLWTIPIR